MERTIISIEQAFAYTGRDFKNRPIVDNLPEGDREYALASYDLPVVIEAINKEENDGKTWKPNWNDSTENKYSPIVWIEASKDQPAGFGFSCTGYGYADTDSRVGSRLSFKSPGGLNYFFKQFPELAKQYYLG